MSHHASNAQEEQRSLRQALEDRDTKIKELPFETSNDPSHQAMDMAQTRQAGVYQASAFERKLLLAFHGAADSIKAGICTMLGVELDEGYPQERSMGSKRPLESAAEEEPTAKRLRAADISAEAKPIEFRRIQSPRSKMDCLIQVNLSEGAGSLTHRSDGHGVKVFLDGGGSGSPTIGLQFKYPGSEGKVVARVNWQLDYRLLDRWIVQDFEYVLVKNAPEDKAVNYKKALSQCGEDDAMQRLMCITLRLVPHAAGFCSSTSLLDTPQATKTCLNAIFRGKKDFTLRIWFLVPVLHFDLDKDCLSVMQYLFNRRQEPLGSIQDAYGVHFAELRKDPGAVIPEPISGAIATRTASETDVKSEQVSVSVKIEPLDKDPAENPAFAQGMTATLPTSSADETTLEHAPHTYANRTVPRFEFNFARKPKYARTHAQSDTGAKIEAAATFMTPTLPIDAKPESTPGSASAPTSTKVFGSDDEEEGEIHDD